MPDEVGTANTWREARSRNGCEWGSVKTAKKFIWH
jgi:hypothetical protein